MFRVLPTAYHEHITEKLCLNSENMNRISIKFSIADVHYNLPHKFNISSYQDEVTLTSRQSPNLFYEFC
jgi:hypothetical protein